MQTTKDYSLKIKGLDEATGIFTGVLSTYGPPADLQGDIIEKGAFNQAIAQQGNGYPLLWAHLQSEPIGLAKIADSKDSNSLMLTGTLLMTDSGAQRAYQFMKAGVIRGLSIGYSIGTGEGAVSYSDNGNVRRLRSLRLHECSLVAVPCNQNALVNSGSIKSLAQVEKVLRSYRPGDMKGSDLDQLRAIDLALKSLLRKDALCECDCEECLAGDCADCSDPECTDPNCEGSVKAMQDAKDLELLKSFAAELKRII